ncbi:MAG: acyl-coenzyme A synthetase/AMP-(fatty) acid ligase [Zhongshania sp.]|jgi:long-chain acyl-CoA synthetase
MSDVKNKLTTLLRADNTAPLLSYNGQAWCWSDFAVIVDELERFLAQYNVGGDISIGLIARNRPQQAAVILGMIAQNRAVTMVHAYQSAVAMANDIEQLNLGVVIGDQQDWSDHITAVVKNSGALGIVLPVNRDESCRAVGVYCKNVAHRRSPESLGFEVLSSGTTGAPKRTVMPFSVIQRALDSILAVGPEVAKSADIVSWPFGTIGGLCQLVTASALQRPIALLEKFKLDDWLAAVEQYQPKILFVQPTILRTLLDADVPKEKLKSIQVVSGGAGPLEPELQTRFEERYGIPLLWAYGATEFCGTIISWTFQLRKDFGLTKLGSAGKPIAGVQVRIIDVDSDVVLPAGETGWLEAQVDSLGEAWIRTTDLALLDEDGFVFIKGRGDGAIIRGGFKILPEQIVESLREHPAVLDAAVVGIEDEKLGQIPAAAVELAKGFELTIVALEKHARDRLLSYQIPAKWTIVDSLPRTPTLKVILSDVKKLF